MNALENDEKPVGPRSVGTVTSCFPRKYLGQNPCFVPPKLPYAPIYRYGVGREILHWEYNAVESWDQSKCFCMYNIA